MNHNKVVFLTDFQVGLTMEHARKAVEILNGGPNENAASKRLG